MMFAIRHKPTGWLMPRGNGRGGRGGTFQTPEPISERTRLFATEGGAKAALRWWLAGEAHVVYVNSDCFEEAADEDWRTVRKPERVADDMEIVPMILSPGPPTGEAP